jgi:transposase
MSGLAEILEANAALREEREALMALLAEKDQALTKQSAVIDVVTRRVDELEQALALIHRKHTEPVSERYVPGQEALPFEPGDVAPPPRRPEPEDHEAPPPAKRRGKPKRRSRDSFEHLKKRTIRCKAADDACRNCGGALTVIGQAESFRVDWVPGHFVLDEVVRDKCACPSCPSEGILTVPAPYALDRALCANGLLARILVDKFADHLPLNRQAKRMGREGFVVGSNTLASWVKAGGSLLGRIAMQVRTELLEGAFLQGDDTGMPVQDAGNGTLRKGRLWAFTDQQQVFYAFTDTKAGTAPVALLDGFAGELLLVDGGSEFNEVVRQQELSRAGCWSHLRKRFFEARHAHPREAKLALGTIRDLFLIERDLWGRPTDEVRVERQRHAKPLVDGFYAWATATSISARPESLLGKALSYALNQRATMEQHLEHGEFPMHNNLSELMLRQAVVGRKNWLFARSEGGAEVAATVYTLVGSCQLQGVDPYAYLVDVLGRIQDHPTTRLSELTPLGWRRAREDHA